MPPPENVPQPQPSQQVPQPASLRTFLVGGSVLLAVVIVAGLIINFTTDNSAKNGTLSVTSVENETFGLPLIESLAIDNINTTPYFLKTVPATNPDQAPKIGYFHFNGEVYSSTLTGTARRLTAASLDSFEVLTPEAESLGINFGKDKNAVYFFDTPLQGAEPATFELVQFGFYAKDKNKVYELNEALTEADPKTFHMRNDGLVIDKNALYCGTGQRRIEVRDPSKLQVIARNKLITLIKDDTAVYTGRCEILEIIDSEKSKTYRADPATFTVRGNFASDRKNVFFLGDPEVPFQMNVKILPMADGSTFRQTERTVGENIFIRAEDSKYVYQLTYGLSAAAQEFQNWKFELEAK